MRKIFVIADWAKDPLAKATFQTKVEGFVNAPEDTRITFISTSPSTIEMGYIAYELVLTQLRLGTPSETVIVIDSSSHIHKPKESEKVLIAHINESLYVLTRGYGKSLSFLKPMMSELFSFQMADTSAHFRSQTVLARVAAYFTQYEEKHLDLEEVHVAIVDSIAHDTFYVAHVPQQGVFDLTYKTQHINAIAQEGEFVKVTIENQRFLAYFVPQCDPTLGENIQLFQNELGTPEDPGVSLWVRDLALSIKHSSSPIVAGMKVTIEKA